MKISSSSLSHAPRVFFLWTFGARRWLISLHSFSLPKISAAMVLPKTDGHSSFGMKRSFTVAQNLQQPFSQHRIFFHYFPHIIFLSVQHFVDFAGYQVHNVRYRVCLNAFVLIGCSDNIARCWASWLCEVDIRAFGSHLRPPRCYWRSGSSSLQPFGLPAVWYGQLGPRSLCPW